MTPGRDAGADNAVIAFGEKVISLLDQGRVSSTYKYATLLAIIDVCMEQADQNGVPPSVLHARDVGRRVFEMLWPQAVPWTTAETSETYLRHSSLRSDLITKIADVRRDHGLVAGTSLDTARRLLPEPITEVETVVVATVIGMPLSKLQRYGDGKHAIEDRFIYEFSWPDEVSAARAGRDDFDDRLHLIGNAGEALVRLGGLLRPLIEQKWAAYVGERSGDLVENAFLEEFLFGSSRTALERIRGPLIDLQESSCFYCRDRLTARTEVDHFIPWSRRPDNALDNLVAAHAVCNNSKRASLPSTTHLAEWLTRFQHPLTAELDALAVQVPWPRQASRSLGAARATYAWLPAATKLWEGIEAYELLDPSVVHGLLNAT